MNRLDDSASPVNFARARCLIVSSGADRLSLSLRDLSFCESERREARAAGNKSRERIGEHRRDESDDRSDRGSRQSREERNPGGCFGAAASAGDPTIRVFVRLRLRLAANLSRRHFSSLPSPSDLPLLSGSASEGITMVDAATKFNQVLRVCRWH